MTRAQIYTRLVAHEQIDASASGRVNACFASTRIALDGDQLLNGCFKRNWKGQSEDGLTYYESIGRVLLAGHDLERNSVGRVENLRETDDGRLIGTAVFAPTESGKELATLYAGRWQSSFSSSWLPIEWERAKGRDRTPGSVDFRRVRLLEISCVPCPSDMAAVVQRANRGGDIADAAKTLGVKLAISNIQPHVAEIAIREAARGLKAENFARGLANRSTFFAIAKQTFEGLRK